MTVSKKAEMPWIRDVSSNLTRLVQEILPRGGDERSEGASFDSDDCIRRLLQDAVRENASDIHLDPGPQGYRIRLRVHGDLRDANQLNAEQGRRVIRSLKVSAGLDPVNCFDPQEARLNYLLPEGDIPLRMATAPAYSGR